MSDACTVTAREDGPLIVKGATGLTDENGNAAEVRPAMGLCRCGLSRNKPFCDGAHGEGGFSSDGDAGALTLGAGAVVELLKDGPLKITSDGEEPVFLCRCGKSANKPYCDGSHGKAGWTST